MTGKTPNLRRKSLSHSFSSVPVTALSSFLSEFCVQISSVTTGGDSAPPCSSVGSSFHSTAWLKDQLKRSNKKEIRFYIACLYSD